MCGEKALPLLGIVVLLFCVSTVSGVVLDCETVTSYFSACSTFITYGTPDPFPGSPCCLSVSSMNNTLSTTEDRRQACRCIMGLIATYSSHAIAIATLPGFCGISFGFTIHPNTECDYYLLVLHVAVYHEEESAMEAMKFGLGCNQGERKLLLGIEEGLEIH